jgi:NitT/TauT family transport system ATP-binding protein
VTTAGLGESQAGIGHGRSDAGSPGPRDDVRGRAEGPQATTPHEEAIAIREVSHSYPGPTGVAVPALANVSISVREGEFVAVVGPSGCGKTTLLNLISGLLRPTTGQVHVGGVAVDGLRRDVSYMPSQDSLLPWRTVQANVEFPLSIRRTAKRERASVARRLLEAVGLIEYAGYYPDALSRGMRQRVAIARTFSTDSRILLMDEPFSALDAQTRILVQDLFLGIWEKRHQTVVLITHDVQEAVALADRVIVFSRAPGTVNRTHEISIPRPRSFEHLLFESRAFQDYVSEVWASLRGGVDSDA